MGLLTEGSPLSWKETKKYAQHVKNHGVIQFLSIHKRIKNRTGDILKWGDEVEYLLVKMDHENRRARVCLRGPDILKVLQEKELNNPSGVTSLWRPEYGAYMLEGLPGKPYGGLMAHFNVVEANMNARREEVQQLLRPDEILISLTNFPRLGCPNFTDPPSLPTPEDGASRSLFFPDTAIFPSHPRFRTLTRNIRERRTEKVAINVPLYRDENTEWPFREDFSTLGDDGERGRNSLVNHIYLDAMGFGMGCCCLQLTFQACCIEEARTLYDQLAPLCPVMLALSAASPIYRGYLSDVDCRWDIISSSVDCRTREERGLEPLCKDRFVIPKSRYDSISSYLSDLGEGYNDIGLVMDEGIYEQLRREGVDHLLAQHVAHLFIRDPVSLFSEKLYLDDSVDTDHFENIQSTNWQTMRFKPPPAGSETIGWRVEFRPCEIQVTDFENAAFVCFVVLLTRVILSYHYTFLIPISKVDENMKRAQRRDAVNTQKFWFRTNFTTPDSPPRPCCPNINEAEFTEMTINEIINGKEGGFPGLVTMIQDYLSDMEVDADTHCTIRNYLGFIRKKAASELPTMAQWIRTFVHNHPEYKKDSVISEGINYDLIKTTYEIQTGQREALDLLGTTISRSSSNIPSAVKKADLIYRQASNH